jgi:hypothetical protein
MGFGDSRKMTYLRIEEKDPCVYRAVSFTDAIGQFDLEEQGFSRL